MSSAAEIPTMPITCPRCIDILASGEVEMSKSAERVRGYLTQVHESEGHPPSPMPGRHLDAEEIVARVRGRKPKVTIHSHWSQCRKKRRHPTQDAAVTAIRRMSRYGLEEYRCPHCGWWHVGNIEKRH